MGDTRLKQNLNRALVWCNVLFFMWLWFWVMPDCDRWVGGRRAKERRAESGCLKDDPPDGCWSEDTTEANKFN
ncbi:hypothetical protein CJD36_004770 [Flavipsychrobacter stenotrophus]|uniref:Uncharacterized protein n=1 Tax=Flavipsychrobacter stenotrophus TaxID=2077091 RepID=A0A2S7T1I2_9BACT|nr:hypothetical protein CJD36_004770 [Flavipsychrobacter stenotrophus]